MRPSEYKLSNMGPEIEKKRNVASYTRTSWVSIVFTSARCTRTCAEDDDGFASAKQIAEKERAFSDSSCALLLNAARICRRIRVPQQL